MDNNQIAQFNYYQWRRHYLLGLLLIRNIHETSRKKQKNIKKRKMWVRNIFLKRHEQGDYNNLLKEMRLGDISRHHNYIRMSPKQFDYLLSKMEEALVKRDVVRESISPGERLALTLRYLASGDSMMSISYAYRVGKSSVSNIIRETCEIIWQFLSQDYLKPPNTKKWKEISDGFNKLWQMPNCVGAVDGKHVVIQAPPNSGSDFYNYKGSHSIVLMAISDHLYKFTLVDIGARGRQSDGGILRNSVMGKKLMNNELGFPTDCPVEYGGENIPFYIVGDEAFPLRPNLMRPYPGRLLSQEKRIFNYRLSRARRVAENTFGIWAARWRILYRPINTCLETTQNIIKATICLHNYLMDEKHELYCPTNFLDYEDKNGNFINGLWREEGSSNNIFPASRTGSNNASLNAAMVRSHLTSHFMFDGAVSFQWNK